MCISESIFLKNLVLRQLFRAEEYKNIAMDESQPQKIIVMGDPVAETAESEVGDVTVGDEQDILESIEQPAKVMRIGSMVKQLLEEVRQAPLDKKSRERLRDIYQKSITELAASLSPDLREELDRLVLPFESEEPSDAELRIAQAQLLGWLEGLFHGIQAAVFAQQMAARAQLEELRSRGLPQASQIDVNHAGPGMYL